MKKSLLKYSCPWGFAFIFCLGAVNLNCVAAKKVDYSQLKASEFDSLKDGHVFTDNFSKETFKIINIRNERGLRVQVQEGEKKRWKRHGVLYRVRKDGSVSEKVSYEYGKKHGPHERYNKKAVTTDRTNFSNGVKHGEYQRFTDKGALFAEGQYVNGKKEGVWKEYNRGKLLFEKNYVQGKLHGLRLQYNTKGKIVAKTRYKKGKKIGKTEWID